MGFGQKWICWSRWCISIVSFSVLVDDTSSGFLQCSKGPIFSIFVCVSHRSAQHSIKEGGFLLGFKVNGRGGDGLEVSHLLFANETLVFCETSQDQLTHLSWLLM